MNIHKHGTGINAWLWRESIWIAPVVGFGIAIALTYGVMQWL